MRVVVTGVGDVMVAVALAVDAVVSPSNCAMPDVAFKSRTAAKAAARRDMFKFKS